MKSVLIFVALCVVFVNTQAPIICVAPPALQGVLHEIDTRRTVSVHANWTYDAIGERVRIDEGIRTNRSEGRQYYDTIILFKEGVQYVTDLQTRECRKSELPPGTKFHPIGVPPGATSYGEAVIGSSVEPNLGLTVNVWGGSSQRDPGGRYFGSWTQKDCLPVLEFNTLPNGVVIRQSFFDLTLGYDPQRFVPPSNCM